MSAAGDRQSAGDGLRPQRVDARRNVRAILEAAKVTFAATGVDAPAKQITDLAGVGVGTLYRHFPRRSDLILAVLEHEIDECIDVAKSLTESVDPGEALLGWIDRFTDFVSTKQGFAGALHSGDPAYADLADVLLDRLEPTLDDLLDKASASAFSVRDKVPARDILITVALICQPVPGKPPSFNKQMAQVFVHSLLSCQI